MYLLFVVTSKQYFCYPFFTVHVLVRITQSVHHEKCMLTSRKGYIFEIMPNTNITSLSSESSSDDDSDGSDIYTNAALKLNALISQKKSKNIVQIKSNKSMVETNNCESIDPIPEPISVVESDSSNDCAAAKSQEIKETCDQEDPVVCIDDAQCFVVNNSPYRRNTRNSRKRKSQVPELVKNSQKFNDSIEEELNRSYDDSFNLSQEDNDNCVMIGSPEIKKSNSDNTHVTIKVLWKSDECQRFELEKNETFQKVFKSLAKLEGISEDQVLITKKDKKITPFDTPASIGWSILDILDGGIVSVDVVKKHKGNAAQEDGSEGGCKLKIQTSDRRTMTFTLQHDEPFSKLLKACSEELNIPESKIKLYFDGEMIEMDESPETLDLEDEGCIDCKISK